jgi:hypothetical protein
MSLGTSDPVRPPKRVHLFTETTCDRQAALRSQTASARWNASWRRVTAPINLVLYPIVCGCSVRADPARRGASWFCPDATRVTSGSVIRRQEKEETHMATWLLIVIIVLAVLAVFGYFGRGRFSR